MRHGTRRPGSACAGCDDASAAHGDPISADRRRRLPESRNAWSSGLQKVYCPPKAPGRPRGTYRYSNAGYVIAGAMIEAATGETWEDLLQREVFGPLGMTASGFGPPGVAGSVTEPRGHRPAGGNWLPVEPGPFADNPAALGPAGTVHAPLADYARFMAAHLAGARGEAGGLLTAESYETLHTPAPGSEYAFGWAVTERDWAGAGRRVLVHSGSNTMWFATVWIAPERSLAMFAVTNAAGDAGPKGTDAAIGALLARYDAAYPGGS
jgi:CubicO group peptidase (beta-lactamase class C family)